MAVFFAVAAVCVILDRLSKLAALRHLADGRRVNLLGDVLGLRLLFNPGASLGMGSGSTQVIAVLAIVACVVLCVAAWHTTSIAWTLALSMCCAGALGNLIDRVYYATGVLDGKVVDFIDYGWSIGNVADIELFIAAVLIVALVCADVPFSQAWRHGADTHEDEEDVHADSARQGGAGA